MSKSLEQKITDKIREIGKQLDEQQIIPTEQKLLEEIRKVKEYRKTPETILRKNVSNVYNQDEIEKKLKKRSINNQLPYIKKQQSSQNSRTNLDNTDDPIGNEIKEVIQKKIKKEENNNESEIDNIIGLSQLGGISEALQSIQEHIYLPLQNQEIFASLQVTPPKGLLLTGPAGSGKTALGLGICKDIFVQFDIPFFFKTSTELIGGISGESEKNLRKLFKDASQAAPSIIFIDEIDAIAGSRDKASKEMERRVVSELLSSLDKLPVNVFVIAATSRPESLEQAIRRGGRFDNEVVLNVPNDDQRHEILQKLTANNPLSPEIDLLDFAKRTPGYVPADLSALIRKAGVIAVQRIVHTFPKKQICLFEQNKQSIQQMEQKMQAQNNQKLIQEQYALKDNNDITTTAEDKIEVEEQQLNNSNNNNEQQQQNIIVQQETSDQIQDQNIQNNNNQEQNQQNGVQQQQQQNYQIIKSDFEQALTEVQPTGKREGFTSIPGVTWEDIGGMKVLKEDLYNNIIMPITYPERFEKFGINSPSGVLLYGPPGCGKTLLAKAVANASRANFISVKGPELLNKYVGESEKSVRSLFARAKASSPCIIFFDELDALCPKRGSDGNQVTERVVNSLLAELDGVDGRKQVYIIGATNRPDIIDPAMLRGGRLDKLFYVPLPDDDDRLQILKASLRKMPMDSDIDLTKISHSAKALNYSGADLASLAKEAGLLSILKQRNTVGQEQLMESFKKSSPSLSEHDRRSYEKLQKNLRQAKQKINDTL